MRFCRSIFVFFSCFLSVIKIYSQEIHSLKQPVFDKINRSNGLSNNRVNTIVKGPNGFVWIGTNNGLNRYDGKDVRIYNVQNSKLVSNDITDILIDASGSMWIATRGGGLNLYNHNKDNFKVFRNKANDKTTISSNIINVLYEAKNGNIWIGTENGFCLFDKESEKFIFWLNTFESGVTSFLETKQGILIGTFGNGLKLYNEENQILEDILEDHPDLNFIHTIFSLTKDEVLIGTSGFGLIHLNTSKMQVSDFLADRLNFDENINIVRTIKSDASGNLWIGTDGDGLLHIVNINNNKPKVTRYIRKPQVVSSLSGNAIYDVFIDDRNNIWLATAWNGVDYLNITNGYDIILSDVKGETTAPVLSICKTADRFLMGLDGQGLTILNNHSGVLKGLNDNDLMSSYVQHITEASDGTFWLGTFRKGLINIDANGKTLKKYQHENKESPLIHNDIRYLVEDSKNNFWVASWEGGLSYLDTKTNTFTQYTKQNDNENSLSSNNVVSLQKDGKFLWVATFGGGINKLDTETKIFTQFKHDENNENSLSSDNTFSLLKDSKGFLWIGTSGNGVNRYNPKEDRMERFNNEKAIKHAYVVSIIEDEHGKIWFGTKDGILYFDYNTNKFNSLQGLQDEFHINSAFADSSGELYFGGPQGIKSFNQEKISYNQKSPKVLITDIKLFNKSVPITATGILQKNILLTDKLSLKYDQDVVTFNFSALKYPFSSQMEYAIKLENFDSEWRNIGEERTATYTNLKSGNYTFKVKTRKKGMDWGNNEASIDVKILKAFWVKWWAYLIYASLLLFILYFLRSYMLEWQLMKTNLKLEQVTNEKNEEVYNIKQRFFMNISHEIRTPLTLIISALKGLGKEPLSLKGQKCLSTVNRNATRLIDLVEELLNFRKLEAGSLKLAVSENDIIGFIRDIYMSFGQQDVNNLIDFQFVTPYDELVVWFDKRQLEKAIVNIIANAFKFTPINGKIKIEVQKVDNKQVCISVSDTGSGIPKEKLVKIFNRFYQNTVTDKSGFGIGLSIAHEIIKLHGGIIKVDSIEGKGSEFNMFLPFGKKHFSKESIVIPLIQMPVKEVNEENNAEHLLEVIDSDLNKTILIVEDHKELREYIREILDDNYKVIEASNGENGLIIALEELPDLVISDIMMPEMDGKIFCNTLKTNIGTSHIPVILLTALTSIENKLESYCIGADDYITKPFNEEILLAKVKSLLHNRELIRKVFNTDGLILPRDLALNTTDQEFMEKLIALIETNLNTSKICAKYLSDKMGMSHSVLYKKIKALTGMNIIEFIRDYKLRVAKKILESQSISVSDVCYRVGYTDRKHFSKLFNKRFGAPPSSFLKRKEEL